MEHILGGHHEVLFRKVDLFVDLEPIHIFP